MGRKSKLMYKFFQKVGLGILVGSAIYACQKDPISLNNLVGSNDSRWGTPLVDSELDVYDIISVDDSTSTLQVNENTRVLTLIFEGESTTLSIDDLITIEDQSQVESLDLTLAEKGSLVANQTVEKMLEYEFEFNTDEGYEIDSIDFAAGNLVVSFTTDIRHNAEVIITVPGLKDQNGTVFTHTFNYNFQTSPNELTQTFDISGYSLDLTNGGTTFNQAGIQYDITFIGTGQPVDDNPRIDLLQSINGIQIKTLYGDIGQNSIPIEQESLDINILNSTLEGFFQLIDPRVEFSIVNYFGVPISVDMSSIEVTENGQTSSIFGPGQNGVFMINAPTENTDSVTTIIELNNTNSNINVIATPTNKSILFNLTTMSNPDGPASPRNFIDQEDVMRINSRIELPLYGHASDWAIQDTVDANFFGDDTSTDIIKEILLRLSFENGFPLNVNIEIQALDSANNVSTVVDNIPLLLAASVDNDGVVTSSRPSSTEIVLEGERLDQFVKAQKLILKAEAETLDGSSSTPPDVKILDTYKLGIKMGAIIGTEINNENIDNL